MSLRVPLYSICLAVLSLSSMANADIIVEYEPLDNSLQVNPTLSGSNVNQFVSADDMATGGGLRGTKQGGWKWTRWDDTNTSFADAVADGDTWTFGYDIDDDVQVRLTDLSFKVDPNSTGPENIEIRMTVNGTDEKTVFTHDFAGDYSPQTFNVDLSPFAKFQAQGDSIEFTFAGFNSASTNNGFLILQPFDGAVGLRLDGSVSVPEPGTIGVIAGLAGFVMIRRRRKKKAQAEMDKAA